MESNYANAQVNLFALLNNEDTGARKDIPAVSAWDVRARWAEYRAREKEI